MKMLPEFYECEETAPVTIDSLNQEKSEVRAMRLQMEKETEIVRQKREKESADIIGFIIFAAIVLFFFVK